MLTQLLLGIDAEADDETPEPLVGAEALEEFVADGGEGVVAAEPLVEGAFRLRRRVRLRLVGRLCARALRAGDEDGGEGRRCCDESQCSHWLFSSRTCGVEVQGRARRRLTYPAPRRPRRGSSATASRR